MIIHQLSGCAPTPLAHYLKAIGILRLVSEQLDAEARGWWEGECFLLATTKTEDELVEFFLRDYRPTPLFNPWGARSGFYKGSSEKTSRQVLERIEASLDHRFDQFRAAIQLTRTVIRSVTGGEKPGDTDKDEKARLIRSLRSQLRNSSLSWLEAVIAIVDASDRGVYQPAIFGTGGSEGSVSYTAGFMKALGTCLLDRRWDTALPFCIYGSNTAPQGRWQESFGQFVPNGAATPWDLLLGIEGACAVRSSVVRRSESDANRWSASPFFVAPVSTGFASASRIDEFALNKGKELPGRGEQWFPLWEAPSTSQELLALLAQGRAISTRGGQGVDALCLSRSIARLGTARGITQFIRFGYLQRNNQATHFAVPLGRFVVPDEASPKLACLDDLNAWLPRLRRQSRGKGAPTRLAQAERRLADAVFALTQHPDEPLRWQTVLLRLAEIEAIQVTGSGYAAGPIPKLRPEWVPAADDCSPELRLAVTCALQAASFDQQWRPRRDSGVRRHWLPLKRNGSFLTSGTGGQSRLQHGPDRVIEGRDGVSDAIALVTRRIIEAAQRGVHQIPLRAAHRASASGSDLALLVAGELDLSRTMALARALMAIDAAGWARAPRPTRPSNLSDHPDDAWLVIRLATLPLPLRPGVQIGLDPSIVRRLETGDAATAVNVARQRLRAAGINPSVRAGTVTPNTARLWAAALAFPISASTITRFLARLDPHSSKETAA